MIFEAGLVVMLAAGAAAQQSASVAWLNEHVRQFTDARIGAVRSGTAMWTGCDVTVSNSVAIRDPQLRTAAGTRGTLRIPLQQVSFVERAASATPSGLIDITLHKTPGAHWVSRGVAVNGEASQDDVTHASFAVPAALADQAEAAITRLAVSCGAPIPKAKS